MSELINKYPEFRTPKRELAEALGIGRELAQAS